MKKTNRDPKVVPKYYTIMPAEVRYNTRLSSSAKLLYGDIALLASKDGYCTASNEYLGGLYSVDDKTISDWVSQLAKEDYIRSVVLKDNSRKIYPRVAHLPTRVSEKPDNPSSGKPDNNSTSINTINNIDEGSKEPRTELLNAREHFERLMKSSKKELAIIGYYTLKRKNYEGITSKKQVDAIIGRNIKVARRLSVFDVAKIKKAIDECENTVIQGKPMWYSLETVEKFLLK